MNKLILSQIRGELNNVKALLQEIKAKANEELETYDRNPSVFRRKMTEVSCLTNSIINIEAALIYLSELG